MIDRVRWLVGSELSLGRAAWPAVAAALALSVLGIYAIDVGTSSAVPEGLFTASGRAGKQLVFLVVGLAAAAAIAVPHYRLVRFVAWPAMVAVLALLVFLLIPVVPESIVAPQNGARRWIMIGAVNFQPAEVAKIAYVMVMARYLRYRSNHRRFIGLVPPALMTLAPMALIAVQPDLGGALLFLPPLATMLVAAGARLHHLALATLAAATIAAASYPVMLPHQRVRIQGMILAIRGDPGGAQDINFQRDAAIRLTGAGMAAGVPEAKSRSLIGYNALPEAHTDMVFVVVVNRFGLLGGLAVLVLYGLWLVSALVVAAMNKDAFARLVVVGCATIVATQVFINVGMCLGLVPIVGVTLPFMSYGGSSLLTVWIMTGLVLSAAMRRPRPPYRPSFEYAQDDEPPPRDTWFARA